MPVRKRKTLGSELRDRYELSQKQWAKRISDAAELAAGCATWAQVDDIAQTHFKCPMTRRVRDWIERTGAKILRSDESLLKLLVTVADQYRGLWLSAADLAKRMRCDVKTVYNATVRLEQLDLIRIVPQYVAVDPYHGRTTQRGGGSSGQLYTHRQRPNAITFGDVGKALFGNAAFSKRLRDGLASAVDNLFVASAHQTRQRLPSNPERIAVRDLLVVLAHAVHNPKAWSGPDAVRLSELERFARARTVQLV